MRTWNIWVIQPILFLPFPAHFFADRFISHEYVSNQWKKKHIKYIALNLVQEISLRNIHEVVLLLHILMFASPLNVAICCCLILRTIYGSFSMTWMVATRSPPAKVDHRSPLVATKTCCFFSAIF